MKIYGAILSPFVRKVLTVADMKGLEYEQITVMPGTMEEDYLKISPLGKIPALTEGEFSACDSTAIAEYLEEKYPQNPILPSSPEDRARSRWLEEFGDTRLVECTGIFFFERFVKGLLGKGEADEERLAQAIAEDVPLRVGYLESQVPEEGFLFPEIGLGVADMAVTFPLINGAYGGLELDEGKYPRTLAYLERVKSHPVVANRLAAEAAMLAGR